MDLKTEYLGLSLESPLVVSPSPLGRKLDTIKQLRDHGAAAVVLPSIFEEQITREQEMIDALIGSGSESFGEALSYFPSEAEYAFDSSAYIRLIENAARELDVPVIASLNGVTTSGWVNYAKDTESAGAKAIELNIFFVPSDITLDGREVEKRYTDVVSSVADAVKIPVAVKVGPYFSSTGHMAGKLVEAGAKGLVLFNRFYEPDIDPVNLSVDTSLELSTSSEMRLPLLWIGVLAGRINASLAATTGVHTPDDVIKYLLAGADVVMSTSALLRNGPGHLEVLRNGLTEWLAARNLNSPADIRGKLSHAAVENPEAYERANYIRVLQGYDIG